MTTTRRPRRGLQAAAVLMALAGALPACAAGFKGLSADGDKVRAYCDAKDAPGNDQCLVTSLPGEDGYRATLSRSTAIVHNAVVVGTLDEQVWRSTSDRTMYIFGARITLNAEASDSTGLAFNVNDVFRQSLHRKAVRVAYLPGGASLPLRGAGRTVQGLNEFDGAQPERHNGWVDFRVHVNAAAPDGTSVPNSPWLLMKARAPKGVESNDFGMRLLNSEMDNPDRDAYDLFLPAYQPVGVPPPGDDDDDLQAPPAR